MGRRLSHGLAAVAAGLALAAGTLAGAAGMAGAAGTSSAPAAKTFADRLYGVTTLSRSEAWAVGLTRGHRCAQRCVTFIEHWNGSAWTSVPSPNPGGGYLNALFGVSATGRHNAWAVSTTDYARTLVLHWNGSTWS